MLDELQRQRIGGGGPGHCHHIVGREDAFVGHHRHSRAGAHTRKARDIPGRQRLFDQRHAHVGERRHCAHRGRLVPGLVRVDDQRRAPLERRRDPPQPGEVVRQRLRADLDLEAVVQARGELRLGLLDLLRGVAGGEGPEDRHPLAHDAAEQLHRRHPKRAANCVEECALDRGLCGVVALRRGVHASGRRFEPACVGAEHRRREMRVDNCLDALHAFLRPARTAEGGGLADADSAVRQPDLDDDVALGGNRELRELVLPHRRHVDDGAADVGDGQVAPQVGWWCDRTVFHDITFGQESVRGRWVAADGSAMRAQAAGACSRCTSVAGAAATSACSTKSNVIAV